MREIEITRFKDILNIEKGKEKERYRNKYTDISKEVHEIRQKELKYCKGGMVCVGKKETRMSYVLRGGKGRLGLFDASSSPGSSSELSR